MKLSSVTSAVERAQPWLGTLVSIRVEGLALPQAHAAIDTAFAEVAAVHKLMSFHREDSDVSKLNQFAASRPIRVHPLTFTVLQIALDLSSRTNGCFDISVATQLADWGFLPTMSVGNCAPQGSWRDIELHADGSVLFHRPLLIDLGGIAKGFAVDRAMDALCSQNVRRCVVNAGGDISVSGEQAERIALDRGIPANDLPVLELRNGSVASSTGLRKASWHYGHKVGPHVHGVSRLPSPAERFASVVANRCIIADALTKVVLAEGANSRNLLQQFGATAHLYEPEGRWVHLEP